jgi:hypothetical protein
MIQRQARYRRLRVKRNELQLRCSCASGLTRHHVPQMLKDVRIIR